MKTNPFINVDMYQRDLNVLQGALEDQAHFLSKMRKIPLSEAREFIIKLTSKDGKHPIKDPKMNCLVRQSNGDRVKKAIPATKLLEHVQANNMPMSPSMAIYDSEATNKSVLSIATEAHVELRAVAKTERNEAEVSGDTNRYLIKENEQQNAKIFNNSLSGAQVSLATILNNPAAHPALTGLCRVCSGYGNANNEKFLGGNRHYWSRTIVLSNISSICNMTDYLTFKRAMDKYNLHYPTVSECMDLIKESSKYYWPIADNGDMILTYVTALSPLERAMFMYVGDMYHLAMYNREVMYDFITKLATVADNPIENPDEVFKDIKGDLRVLTNYVAFPYLKRRNTRDLKEADANDYNMYCATGFKFMNAIEEYSDLITGLWTTKSAPASVAEIPTMVRRVVPASDTDSTIFTLQEWVRWYQGYIDHSEQANNVRDAVVFIASQSIVHYLAMMSINIGVARDKMFLLGMKNEYTFATFAPTNATKHYFARQSAIEGSKLAKLKTELKGVNLKASTSPKYLVDDCHALIDKLLDLPINGEKIELSWLLTHIADKEREIIQSIKHGDPAILKSIEVKEANSYKKEEEAYAYKSHILWEEVFAPSFGHAPTLPYRALRFNLDVQNKTSMLDWLERITDVRMRTRLIAYLESSSKSGLIKTLTIPLSIASENGIPDDIMQCADVRKTITNIMNCYYVMLTGLKIYFLDKKNTNLISDYY